MFLLSKRFWLTVAKLVALAFPLGLIAVQVPELRYDLGSGEPVEITSREQLAPGRQETPRFVSVAGRFDEDRAFVHKTHGVTYTYFLIEPYDERLIVRTAERPTGEWRKFDHFPGKLRSRLPFSYTIKSHFREQFGVEIPDDAYGLVHEDVPALSGWNVAATIFSVCLLAAMVYLFFFFPWRKFRATDDDRDRPYVAPHLGQ